MNSGRNVLSILYLSCRSVLARKRLGCLIHSSACSSAINYKSTFQIIRNCCIIRNMGSTSNYRVEKSQPVMRLDSQEFRDLFTPELVQLSSLFEKYGFELRIAGGAVRDLLMSIAPADLDFATTATPQQMHDLFTKESVRMLNKNGERHGTVTCRINDTVNFEVTTLRVDKICDGRHAEVEFTTDWFKDASRRDLTVNSMFLDLSGNLYDYYDGLNDLKKRRIAFVGHPEDRIQEDYLRILRYFRFYGRLADAPNCHEEETLQAIKANAAGLTGISGERLWTELKRIAVGRFAGPVIREMIVCGIAPYLGLPTTSNVAEFERIVQLTDGLDPKCMTVIPALLENENDVLALEKRMKFSAAERLLGLFIVKQRDRPDLKGRTSIDKLKIFQDLLLEEKFRPSAGGDGESRVFELLKYQGDKDLLEVLAEWSLQKPTFPMNGEILTRRGNIKPGKFMKVALDYLFNFWRAQNYTPSTEELLAELKRWKSEHKSRSPSPVQKRGKC